MCGRFVGTRGGDNLVAEFEADMVDDALPPSWNVAPTDPVPAVLTRRRPGEADGPVVRHIRVVRWGLVPSWASDASIASRLINARAETAATMPAFRSALARRRCLIPADGWYEWVPRADGAGRQAYYLTPRDGSVLAFAGLYEFWGDADQRLTTCSIVTTAAVGELVRVHDRMPLVLPRLLWAAWLDPGSDDPSALLAPPAPAVAAAIDMRPVGPAVGNVANNGPELIAPQAAAPEPQTLF